jgi:hypothetical protein
VDDGSTLALRNFVQTPLQAQPEHDITSTFFFTLTILVGLTGDSQYLSGEEVYCAMPALDGNPPPCTNDVIAYMRYLPHVRLHPGIIFRPPLYVIITSINDGWH